MIINFNNINYSPEDFRNFFLTDFESIPNRKGKRPDGNLYDRTETFIKKHNINRSKKDVLKIKNIIENDTPDLFFTKGLFFFEWPLSTTIRFFDEKLYDIDFQGDNIIVSDVANNRGNITNIKIISNKIYEHYNINKVFIYLIGFLNYKGELEPIKKMGFTTVIDERFNPIFTNNYNDPFYIKTWIVDFKDKDKIETFLKTSFKDRKHRNEFFFDFNNNLVNEIDDKIKFFNENLANIPIKSWKDYKKFHEIDS